MAKDGKERIKVTEEEKKKTEAKKARKVKTGSGETEEGKAKIRKAGIGVTDEGKAKIRVTEEGKGKN